MLSNQRQESVCKSIEQKKFIQMMNSLTWHIRENLSHQQKILQFLNSQQQKKLFESIKQENQDLRITSVVFILHLLYKNQRAFNLISKRDGFEVTDGITKYIIGGLMWHKFSKKQLICLMQKIEQVEFQQNALGWSLNIKSKKVTYLKFEKNKQEHNSNLFLFDRLIIDPKQNLIGMFFIKSDLQSKSHMSLGSTGQKASRSSYLEKYKISRR